MRGTIHATCRHSRSEQWTDGALEMDRVAGPHPPLRRLGVRKKNALPDAPRTRLMHPDDAPSDPLRNRLLVPPQQLAPKGSGPLPLALKV